jgi:hypothetical protein
MALLKSLIQRLLDSRTTPEEAGHSAMPSATKTTFLSKDEAVGSWGTLNAGTAPADGYLFVNASAEDSTNSEVRAQLGNLFHVSAQAPAPKGLGVTIPMSKGASYTVEGAFVSHITVGFVKAIGGGYNRLVWRTLSCLRALSNGLLRSFCKAKSLGLEINPSHHLQKLPSLLRTGLNTRLLRTAGFESEVNQLRRQRCMLQWLPFLQEMVQFYVMCPSERVRLSFATSAHTQDKQTASLFPLSVLANLQTGGALC